MALILRQPPTVAGSRLLDLERATAIVLDGLRVRAASALPGRPVTTEDVKLWRAQLVDP